MSFRTAAFLVSLNIASLSLVGCSALGTNSNSPGNVASKYSKLEHLEQYEEASALSTESHAKHLSWIAEQEAKQTSRPIEPWQNFKATSINQKINNTVANVELLTEGDYKGTPHWCINKVELQEIEDTWKVDSVTTVKCGSNSQPSK